MAQILIVDDDQHICSALAEFLGDEGHEPRIASNAEDALKSLAERRPDLILMDIRMPGLDGLGALKKIRQLDEIFVVIMTAYGTSQTSIEAMRLGAFDYLTKPFDLSLLKQVVDRALEAGAIEREVIQEPAEKPHKDWTVNLVGSSPRMEEAYKLIGMLATNNLPALVVGEPGVGKLLVAQTIHFNSDRRAAPFRTVHCRGIPGSLLEAEIFGRESESPEGGRRITTPGKLEAAKGGTLFLDDVETLPIHLQAKLLGFLANKTFERSRGTRSQRADTRIIAATEKELSQYVREGSFIKELFQTLRTLSIGLPPLRERREDLPDLVAHILEGCNVELGRTLAGVGPRVMESFEAYSWPGNIGELASVIKRAAVMARGDIVTLADLGDSLQSLSSVRSEEVESALELAVRRTLRHRLTDPAATEPASHFRAIIGQVEQILVREALAETSGNQLRAAALLGLNRTTLRTKAGL